MTEPVVIAKPRRRRLRRFLVVLGVLLVVGFVAGELVLRFGLGLGDPPLMMNDSLTYYRFSPSQTVHRFHHLIHYNAFSMRSDDCSAKKTDPHELRVLVIGDSIINGGNATDQSELATSLLQEKLKTDLHRPVMVGNASAGGWGPPSEWGWMQEFGLLDADVVVLVLESADYADVPRLPTRVGRAADMPTHKPLLAWSDFIERYVLERYFHVGLSAEPIPTGNEVAKQSDIDWCAQCIRQMIHTAHEHGAKVILVQCMEQEELDHGNKAGYESNYATANSEHVDEVVRLGPSYAASRAAGVDPYRKGDNIHPNAVGQRLIYEALLPVIEKITK